MKLLRVRRRRLIEFKTDDLSYSSTSKNGSVSASCEIEDFQLRRSQVWGLEVALRLFKAGKHLKVVVDYQYCVHR